MAAADAPHLAAHAHGKACVRVGRAWRDEGGVHHFREWSVSTRLESDMAHAFLTPSNAGMTATDTQKHAVYHVAKRLPKACGPEVLALALARLFLARYPLVSAAKVEVVEAPWARAAAPGGAPHAHGFADAGGGERTAAVELRRGAAAAEVTAGVRGWRVLKTTQSGYAGFLHDDLTTLPNTIERIMATVVTATWRYAAPPPCYDAAHAAARAALASAFFGPPRGGVFSPSVQFTLFQMAAAVLAAIPAAERVALRLPNLHFLPCAPPGDVFEDDVYIATSEPHGDIEAVVTRGAGAPARARL
jgi:urate oxidase